MSNRYMSTLVKVGGIGLVSYSLYRVIESSQKDVPSYGRDTNQKDFNEKKIMVDTLLGQGPGDMKQLRERTEEKRRRIADEYAKAQYEKVLQDQQREKEGKQ